MILIILYVLTAIGGLLYRKSKFLFLWDFFLAWFIIAGNDSNPDFETYVTRYEIGLGMLLEPGFGLICHIFKTFGASYIVFKAIVSFFSLSLIFYTLKKFCQNITLSSTLFLLYPFIIDVIQFRNFISYSIVIFAIPYLFDRTSGALRKYILFVLIATTVHSASFFYLSFIFARKNIKLAHLLIALVVVAFMKVTIFDYFQTRFDTEKLSTYESPSLLGAVFMSSLLVINTCIVWSFYKKRKIIPVQINGLGGYFLVNNPLWPNITLLFLLITPLLFSIASFERLYRNLLVIDLIFLANAYYVKKNIRFIIVSMYLLYYITTGYFTGDSFEYKFIPVFSNNFIFNSL